MVYFLGDNILVPNIRLRDITGTILFGAGPNPVEAGPIAFHGTRGLFTLSVRDDITGYMFSFRIEGGRTAANPSAVMSQFYARFGTALGVTVTQTALNVMTCITPAPDLRTYVITFSPYLTVLPTIQKTAGAALAGSLTVVAADAVPAE